MTKSETLELEQALADGYYTVDQALEYVQKQHPGKEVSRRQIVRAVADGNLQAKKIGRLLYIPHDQVEWYANQLKPTHTNPEKLRLNQNA